MKVICNAIVYRISIKYIPTKGRQSKGLAKALFTIQSECLYIVIGIYRTTPIHCLKKKVDILSINIYLNKKIADFERRLVESEMTKCHDTGIHRQHTDHFDIHNNYIHHTQGHDWQQPGHMPGSLIRV